MTSGTTGRGGTASGDGGARLVQQLDLWTAVGIVYGYLTNEMWSSWWLKPRASSYCSRFADDEEEVKISTWRGKRWSYLQNGKNDRIA